VRLSKFLRRRFKIKPIDDPKERDMFREKIVVENDDIDGPESFEMPSEFPTLKEEGGQSEPHGAKVAPESIVAESKAEMGKGGVRSALTLAEPPPASVAVPVAVPASTGTVPPMLQGGAPPPGSIEEWVNGKGNSSALPQPSAGKA
jgi:hypothetical protein